MYTYLPGWETIVFSCSVALYFWILQRFLGYDKWAQTALSESSELFVTVVLVLLGAFLSAMLVNIIVQMFREGREAASESEISDEDFKRLSVDGIEFDMTGFI